MEENIFQYGLFELDKSELKKVLQSNFQNFAEHQLLYGDEASLVSKALAQLVEGVDNGTLVSDDLGNLRDNTGTWVSDKAHNKAVLYFKTVANAYGKRLDKKKVRDTEEPPQDPVKEKFDYSKHGFARYFLEQTNPTMLSYKYENKDLYNTEFDNNINTWRSQYSTDAEAIQAFSNMLDDYKTRHLYENFDFSDYGSNDTSYLNDIRLLQESLKDGTIDSVDNYRLKKLGLENWDLFFIKDTKPIKKPGEKPTDNPEIPTLNTLVSGADRANKEGDWYEENVNGKRTRFVLNDKGEFISVPIISVNQDTINTLKTILKTKYRNRYESENMDSKVDNLVTAINNYGAGTGAFLDNISNLQGYEEVKQLLKGIGYTDENANNYIKSLSNLGEKPEFDSTKFWDNLSWEDKTRVYSAIADVGSAIAAWFPGYGTAVSGVVGLGSSAANAVADFSEQPFGEALLNLGMNLGLDIWGVLPAVGTSGKLAKIARIIKPVSNIINLGLAGAGAYTTIPGLTLAWEKIQNNPDELNGDDLKAILFGLNLLTSGVKNAGVKRQANNNLNDFEKFYPIKTKDGKKAKLTLELLNAIRSKSTLEEQNSEFKKYYPELELETKLTGNKWEKTKNYLNTSYRRTSKEGKEDNYFNNPFRRKKSDTSRRTVPDTEIPTQKRFNPDGKEITSYEAGKIYKDEKGDFYKFKEDNTWEPISKEKVTTKDNDFVLKEGDSEVMEMRVERVDDTPKTTSEPATEIKPDTKPDIESEVSSLKSKEYERRKSEYGEEIADLMEDLENLKQSNSKRKKNLGKLLAELKKRKPLDDDSKYVLQKALADNDNNYFSKSFNTLVEEIHRKLPGRDIKEIRQKLFNAGLYKKGGILKGELGIGGLFGIPEWFYNKQGNNQSLLGWSKSLNNSNRGNLPTNLTAHNLTSVYSKNKAYTLDTAAVGSDISMAFINMNYTNDSFIGDLGDLNFNNAISQYNEKIKTLTDFLNKTYKYNDTREHIKNFADLYKSMYNSRSLGNTNKEYDLGFNDKISNIYGSDMFHRRVDVYEKEFDLLTDLEKHNRLFKITDGRYVYKNADGTISALDPTEAARILATKSQEDKKGEGVDVEENKQEPYFVPDEGKIDIKHNTGKPDWLGMAGSAFNYFNTLRHNKKLLELANELKPLLYDPVEHHRYVLGDLNAINQGQMNYAKLRSMASQPMTSDANLQMAQQLEAENKGLEFFNQGRLLDNQAIKESMEAAWEQEKQNKENRYNIAMKNRENISQVDKEKLLAKMNKENSDYQSTTNFVNEIKTYLTLAQKEREVADEKGQMLALANRIKLSPKSYFGGEWTEREQKIWDRYNKGEVLNENELLILGRIKDAMEAIYLNELNPGYAFIIPKLNGSVVPYGELQVKFELKGGKLTHKEVKTIISFLKESNNNYNKAIDRSVKGLYNHIKEQKRNRRK